MDLPESIARGFAHIRDPALVERLNAFLAEFQDESDRAAAVLAAAYLDHALFGLLTAAFVENDRIASRLLAVDRPLGSFSARILCCYCLGLVSRDEFDELERVRKIRNDFAHEQQGFTFSTEPVASHANAMTFHRLIPVAGQSLPGFKAPDSPRRTFNQSIVVLTLSLHLREAAVSRLSELPRQWSQQVK